MPRYVFHFDQTRTTVRPYNATRNAGILLSIFMLHVPTIIIVIISIYLAFCTGRYHICESC